MEDARQQYAVDDQRLLLPPVDFNSRIKLRDYQTPAVEKLVKCGNGGLFGGCGSGKTQIMLEVIARLKQPALWITHTKELMNQLIDRACLCFNDMTPDEIGIIAEGKVSIGSRLTVALVQTLSRIDIDLISDKSGPVIVDEGTIYRRPHSKLFAASGQTSSVVLRNTDREDGLGK